MTPIRRRVLAGLIVLFLLGIGLLIGYCLPDYSATSGMIGSTLQTLIAAQASVLAIVFSVAFVATQIVSARYSPAFIKIFVRSPLLREALYLAIGSIFISLGVLVLLPVLRLNTQQSLFVWSVEITGAVLLGVAIYAGLFFEQTTPTNLLRQYQSQLSPTDYQSQSIDAGAENSLADHPLQPVYDLTRTSIQRDELAVASEGEKAIHEIVDTVVDDRVRTGKVDIIDVPENYDDQYATTEDASKIGILFTPVLSQYFPRIALSAASTNYIKLSQSSINHLGDIGMKGVEHECHTLADLALMAIYSDIMLGLSDPIEDSSGHSRALHFSVENSLNIIGQYVYNGDLEHFHEVSPHAYEVMRWADGITPNQNLVQNVTINELIERQVEWYKKTVSEFEDELSQKNPTVKEMLGNRDRDGVSLNRDWDSRQHENLKISSLINIRLHMMTITARNYKSVDWPGESGTVPIFISSAWRELLEYAVTHPPAASGILLLERYLEIVGYTLVERDNPSSLESSANLVMVMNVGGIIPFERAFNRILENPEHEDFFGYTTFRGLGRGSLWFPFRMYDYSDEFIEAVKELRADLRTKYWDERFEKAQSTASSLSQLLQYQTDEW